MAAPVIWQELALVGSSAAVIWLASRSGATTVAAIGLIDALAQLLQVLISVVAIGAGIVTAHGLGAGRRDQMPALAGSALGLALAIGLAMVLVLELGRGTLLRLGFGGASPDVLAAADRYLLWVIAANPLTALLLSGSAVLRSLGHAAAATRAHVVMNLVQVAAAAVAMHGVHLAELGAGLALFGARALGAGLVAAALWAALQAPPLARCRPQPALMRAMWQVGWPVAFETVFFHVGKLLTQAMVAGLGTAALAANFIAFSVTALLNIPGAALGQAASVRMGHRLGAGQVPAARVDLRRIWRSATWLTGAMAVPVLPLSWVLAGAYTSDPEVVQAAGELIALNCLFMPLWAASFVLPQGLRGAGDTLYTMVVAAVSMWSARILLGWWLGRQLGWGVTGIWLGMFADWAFRGGLFWRRSRSLAWTRHHVQR